MRTGGFCVALLFIVQALHAQAPRVEARLDTAAVRIGDPIRLTLTIRHSADVRPDVPDLAAALETFNPRCGVWHQVAWGESGHKVWQDCQLLIYALGPHQVPPIEVALIAASGDTLRRASQPLAIEVVSARGEGDDQPRDIKPPLAIAGGIPLWVAALLAVVLLGLLALLVYWLWRRWSRKAEPEPPPEPVDFVAEFARIAQLGLLERGHFKTYYSLLSETLRRFIERDAGVEAMEQTTGELAAALKGVGVESALAQRVVGYLEAADLVKFARFHPDVDAARRAPEAGLALLRDIEADIAARTATAEAHAEHPV